MRTYIHSNSEIIWAMKELYAMADPFPNLQVDRVHRVLRTDLSDKTWALPEGWDLG